MLTRRRGSGHTRVWPTVSGPQAASTGEDKMDPIDSTALDALNFEKAALAESSAWRNLLPPEPWLAVVGKDPKRFGDYARYRLEAGIPNAPSVVSRARKRHQQTRPVPVVGIAERIGYRVLCDHVLAQRAPADRSQEAYELFIGGPIRAAFAKKQFMRPGDAIIKYVVESDIAAFYEYVDHSRLLDELQLRTATVEFPRHLVRLLAEVQGRPYGLPQLLDSSDELSEIYVRIIERELRRRDIDLWRYNDDFRMIAKTYDEAQAHVEALAHEASAVGLVLNERKTRVIKFINYFWKNWLETQTEGDVEFKPELIKIMGDYGELEDSELATIAHETFDRLDLAPDAGHRIDLAALAADDDHALSRAIGILTAQKDAHGLDQVPALFEYAPHLCHRLGTYLVALHESGTDVGPTWDTLMTRSAFFNAWQRVWLIYIARIAKLLTDPSRQAWVKSQRSDTDPLLRAEATLALAPHKLEIGRAHV